MSGERRAAGFSPRGRSNTRTPHAGAQAGRYGRAWNSSAWLLAAPILLLAAVEATSQTIVLEGGRIIPVVGEEIEKGRVLIRDGHIESITSLNRPRGRPRGDAAPPAEIPFDAKVIDVSGKTIFPGLIDVHTARGLDVPNESPPVTPFLNVKDAIDPSQLFFEDALRDGVLSIHVIVGNNCVIGGLSRVVHPIGLTPDEMTTAADVALKLSLTPRRGFDRMRQMATFRETFRKLKEDMGRLAEKRYEDTLREQKKDLDVPPDEARQRGKKLIRLEDIPEKDRNLLKLTQGQMRAFVYCGNAMDVPAAVKLARENGFFEQSVFVLGSECYKAIDVLKEAGRPVVLDANLIHRETDPITGEEKETFVPTLIDEAGLKFALQRRPGTSLGERYLGYQAARCVREGIDRSKALQAITLWPAEMIGQGKRLGSIEPGKDANLLVLSGDPLDMQTWVEKGFVQGIEVYDREEDIRLKRLLAEPESDLGPSSKPDETTTGEAETKASADKKTDNTDKKPDKPRRRRGRRGRRGPPGGR
ncbi:MAG: amidohydrolase family protein [Phycisphaerae bacterium]